MSFTSTPAIVRTISQAAGAEDEKFARVLNVEEKPQSPTAAGATKRGGPRNMPLFILRQIVSRRVSSPRGHGL